MKRKGRLLNWQTSGNYIGPDYSRQQAGSINNKLRTAVVVWVTITIAITLAACTKPETSRSDSSNPDRLNVSEPTFSTAGILFTLNDTRPNGSLWVSVKIGRGSANKNFMSWISLSGIKSGTVSIPFRDCKYLDEGLTSLADATKCEVTIGAKLKDADKMTPSLGKVTVGRLSKD